MDHAATDRWQNAVRHLLHINRPEQAEQLVRRRLAHHPQEAYAHVLLALTILNQKGRLAEAIPVLQDAIALNPQSSDAQYFNSVALLRGGYSEEALQAIDEALRLHSWSATYLGHKAVILNTRDQPKKALEATTIGLQIHPGHDECLYQRILALQKRRKYKKATLVIAQLAYWHPDSALTHFLLGEDAMRAQELEKAEKHLREALRLHPTHTQTQRSLLHVKVQLGEQAYRQHQPMEANQHFLEAWQLSPGNEAVRSNLEQLAKESFWLKRQLLRLDAKSASIHEQIANHSNRATFQLFFILVPLVCLFCIPLILLSCYAAVQWRWHPTVRMLNKSSRKSFTERVLPIVALGATLIGLVVSICYWMAV
ncbi:tetratricopeptide repeat protein [Hymenobacter taeanensis]|uniref:Tetratricopeptide repeat protein n=1 Tax=Hymenobacter taeanensis TaxID=2735321 RepID=A0A6M6BHS1_9BACT|nr:MULTISPECIES: tetratricopeptide repeat protein [Hymenobacter]QJX47448.1 tetratricopeptide repeat protein [Hymenobacter taeanensis]UOQ83070.1 tetratricopeptide repeat protein [Hymenobacter sp. 5414T-23]